MLNNLTWFWLGFFSFPMMISIVAIIMVAEEENSFNERDKK